MLLSPAIVVMAALAVPPVPVVTETAVLDAPSPTVSATFGIIVGISGDRIIATGPEKSRSGGAVGQVATFDMETTGTWAPRREMLAIEGTLAEHMLLGRVALGGNWLLVSDERRDGGNSGVITFERDPSPSGWRQAGRLQPLASAAEPAFGANIVCDGSIAAISTVDMRVLGEQARTVQESPKVYLFQSTPEGWKGLGFLQRDPVQKPKFFGAALSLTPKQLVIGSPNAIVAAPHQELVVGGASAVVIYRQNEQGLWAIDGELNPPPGYSDWLGYGTGVASDGDIVVVRAAKVTGPGGKLFVYHRSASGWDYEGELKPLSDIVAGAGWGITVAVADGRVVVGDPTALSGQSTGYIGVFARRDDGMWGESVRLKSTVPVSTARWGVSVKAEGNRVLVARPVAERDGVTTGGALLYNLPPTDQAPAVIPTDLVPTADAPLLAPSRGP